MYELVRLIERNSPRATAPDLYASLLAIHDAQSRSLRLRREHRPAAEEILAVTFEKGGTSVLADAYLAVGALNPAQVEFAFGWGVFLQLADDLQDLAEDDAAGIATLFSQAACRVALDGLTNRLLRFGYEVLGRLDGFRDEQLGPLKHLIRNSASTLVAAAARPHNAPDLADRDRPSLLPGTEDGRIGAVALGAQRFQVRPHRGRE